jgi:hypothetical protein
MLGEIETELTDETVGVAEKWRLRQRAELVRGLLASGQRTGDNRH